MDRTTKKEKVYNYKKDEWNYSGNPFKKIGSWFIPEYKVVTKSVDGYYDTTELNQSIDHYFFDLRNESENTKKSFEQILKDSKKQVRDLIERLLQEVKHFQDDIEKQEARIEELGGSISELEKEIKANEETHEWLNKLKEKIKGE